MRYAGFGVQLFATVLVFAWIGQWADRKLGTGGLLTVLAVLLGFGGSLYSLIRGLNRNDDQAQGHGQGKKQDQGRDR